MLALAGLVEGQYVVVMFAGVVTYLRYVFSEYLPLSIMLVRLGLCEK